MANAKLIKTGAGWSVKTKKGTMVALTIENKKYLVFPNSYKKIGSKMPDFIAYANPNN